MFDDVDKTDDFCALGFPPSSRFLLNSWQGCRRNAEAATKQVLLLLYLAHAAATSLHPVVLPLALARRPVYLQTGHCHNNNGGMPHSEGKTSRPAGILKHDSQQAQQQQQHQPQDFAASPSSLMHLNQYSMSPRESSKCTSWSTFSC